MHDVACEFACAVRGCTEKQRETAQNQCFSLLKSQIACQTSANRKHNAVFSTARRINNCGVTADIIKSYCGDKSLWRIVEEVGGYGMYFM